MQTRHYLRSNPTLPLGKILFLSVTQKRTWGAIQSDMEMKGTLRKANLKSVLGPTAEELSFAPPKESSQRKGGPDTGLILRFSLLAGVSRRGSCPCGKRAASLPRPYGLSRQNLRCSGRYKGINGMPSASFRFAVCLFAK
ncbi:MAG: hypothetical protein PHH11_01240 [Methylomonas sp.]|nr:hypothetical protein [Methylomonas sp.]